MSQIPTGGSSYNKLKLQIEQIADQICQSVDGNFDFIISQEEEDESVQKLSMLINFLLDSARRSVEQEQKQKKALEEIDQLKNDFLANISHELRTPLTLILTPLEAMLIDINSIQPNQYREEIKRIARNSYKLYTLVNDLLDFSKAEAGQLQVNLEPVQLYRLIKVQLDDMLPLAHKKQIKINLFFELEDITILLDEKLFARVLVNLVGNAIKFTPEEGSVSVTLRKQDDNLILIISDTGIGIPEKELSIIFDRFRQIEHQTTRQYEGTGIGLALVKEFVQLMQGEVNVKSKLNQGSTFQVKIPIVGVKEIKQQQYKSNQSQDRFDALKNEIFIEDNQNNSDIINPKYNDQEKFNNKPIIVLAEDNDDLRTYVSDHLKHSYQVIAAKNGQIAWDVICKHKPSVIVSDIMMPELNGISLINKLKNDEQLKAIPIILVTAKSGKDAVIFGLDSGADDYLTKPFSLSELDARIRSALRLHQTYLSLQKKSVELKSAFSKLEELNQIMVKMSREAGMSEVASGILHNIGNVLNNVNVSAILIRDLLNDKQSNQRLSKITELLQENKRNLEEYLVKDKKGKLLPEYLVLAMKQLEKNRKKMSQEFKQIIVNVDHIKHVIAMQQSFVKPLAILEPININEFLSEVMQLQKHFFNMEKIELECQFEKALPEITTDKHKLLAILMNLFRNAVHALREANLTNKKITVKTYTNGDHIINIKIIDNGIGIAKKNLEKVFSQGFTTKKEGTGYGLHGSLISAEELGGTVKVNSKGYNSGTCFTIEIPIKQSEEDEP